MELRQTNLISRRIPLEIVTWLKGIVFIGIRVPYAIIWIRFKNWII